MRAKGMGVSVGLPVDRIWNGGSDLQYLFGLKQPIFSYQLLRDNGGAISLAQKGSWDLPLREHREPLSVGLGAPWFPGTRLWLGGTPPLLAGFQGPD